MKARRRDWTAEMTARYNAWRKPLEDSYSDIISPLAAKYGATITDTDIVIIVEMVAGQYNIPGYGANDVTVSVCSPAGNAQIGEYVGWTVIVFDYAIAGGVITELHKKGADPAWILAAVDTAMRRGGRYVQSRIKSGEKARVRHEQHMAQHGGLRRTRPGQQQLRCSYCDADARAAARAV